MLFRSNLQVEVLEVEEGPGLGGAMLAAVACGEYDTVEQAAEQIVRVKEVVEPSPQLVEKYEARYQVFRQIYPALKPVYQVME